jgi:thiamine biosynthesis protein ThiS
MHLTINGKAMDLENGATIRDLLDRMALPAGPVAVEVNRDVIPRARHAETVLHDGDQIEVVTLVGGG